MAFDENLAARVRAVVGAEPGIAEKRMFGGLAFLLDGNMSVGVHAGDLIVRIAPEASELALKQPGARVFDLTGRPMKGWILVAGGGVSDKKSMARWVGQGIAFARSLPAK